MKVELTSITTFRTFQTTSEVIISTTIFTRVELHFTRMVMAGILLIYLPK
jgi:hypothetical protein